MVVQGRRWLAWALLVLVLVLPELPGTHGTEYSDCLELYSDNKCLHPRGTGTPGKSKQSVYCVDHDDAETCIDATDFLESYTIDCNTSIISVWVGTSGIGCKQDAGHSNISMSGCTFLFKATGESNVYGRLKCNTVAQRDESVPYRIWSSRMLYSRLCPQLVSSIPNSRLQRLTFALPCLLGPGPRRAYSTTASFVVAFAFNGLVGLLCIIIFVFVRPRFPQLYEPRTLDADTEMRAADHGWVGWLRSILSIGDDEIFRKCGLDSTMYLVMFRYATFLFFCMAFYVLIVLMPINSRGKFLSGFLFAHNRRTSNRSWMCDHFVLAGEIQEHGIDRVSLANVPEGSDYLWAHLVAAYLVALLAMYLLDHAYRKFVRFRREYLQNRRADSYVVMVRDIPSSCRDDRGLAHYYREEARCSDIYPDVLAATRARNIDALHPVSEQRLKTAIKLERYTFRDQRDGGTARMSIGGTCSGDQRPAVEYLGRTLEQQNADFASARRSAIHVNSYHATGFVAFASQRSATVAAQVLHCAEPYTWSTQRAPEPQDLVWENIGVTSQERAHRTAIASLITGALVVLWVIPVTFVASITTLETLDLWADGLDDVADASPLVQGMVQGVIPTLLLVIFMAVLPGIMKFISRKEGIASKSEIGRSAMAKLFWFQILNVFLVSFIAGSILDIADNFSRDPRGVLKLLGGAIPRTGTFFTTYVMLRSVTGYPTMLLRVWEVLWSLIVGLFYTQTPRELEKARREETWNVAPAAAGDILVFLVGVVYVVVTPIIAPFLVLYFGLGYLTIRHLLYYVYRPTPDSGGLLWPMLFNRLMVALLIAELVVAGVFSVKNNPPVAAMMLPLAAFTLWFWFRTHKGLEAVGDYLPMEVAAEEAPLDEADLQDYVQPELLEVDHLELHHLSHTSYTLSDIPEDLKSKLIYQCDETDKGTTGVAAAFRRSSVNVDRPPSASNTAMTAFEEEADVEA
ncbi:uncharacterized protein MONBRDRAFT_22418 [Monosiga brevicollis MX1]|uniref:CSC1/OSCA1-like 7TM region domain-containing protein n=1 Tax=Monosiga brevicollis TaxID=81824 RepID=A9UQI6_MONBE|nr:uncharacterized protein MONBRDRAFT_22418 [Monosiga brevicollis MX1]EDQ93051.1 predicted protein [Monosiga brevicollis MX1]|eukprot:XP_001742813.1 hypothetical protein [Monosiga brevicollis MX1]